MSEDNSNLEEVLLQAIEESFNGSIEAAQIFFERLFESTLVVPDRYQPQPLSNQPTYPNEFIHILGLQDSEDQDKVVVPVFTSKELINEWCGNELQHKEFSCEKLATTIPEGWWMILNPGQEIAKEFSPWELEQLRGGTERIPVLLSELFPKDIVESIEVREPKEDELTELKEALTAVGAEEGSIKALYLLIEEGLSEDEERISSILIGIEADCQSSAEMEDLKEKVKLVAEPTQIGGNPLKIYTGTDREESLMLGVFKGANSLPL